MVFECSFINIQKLPNDKFRNWQCSGSQYKRESAK